jgi:flagellar motor protein MotB
MKKTIFVIVALSCLISTAGCVSEAKFKRSQDEIRALNYKVAAAESTLRKRNRDLSNMRQRERLAKSEAANVKELLSNNNNRMTDMKSDMVGFEERVRAELATEYQQRMSELQQAMPTVEVSSYGGLVLESGIFFLPGRHQLQAQGKRILNPLIKKIKDPQFASYSIEIAGHTDSDPVKHSKKRYTDNHILAANRANEVRRYLVSQGVSKGSIYISAWGSERPLSSSGPKAKNRRVEIVIHKENGAATMTAGSPR